MLFQDDGKDFEDALYNALKGTEIEVFSTNYPNGRKKVVVDTSLRDKGIINDFVRLLYKNCAKYFPTNSEGDIEFPKDVLAISLQGLDNIIKESIKMTVISIDTNDNLPCRKDKNDI